MQIHHGLSARRADRALDLSRSARYYTLRPCEDGPLIETMQAHIADNSGHSFGLLFARALRPHGRGKTRSWRVYTGLKLNLQRRGKRRLPERIRVRTFNINDDFNRESLKIEINTSLPATRVIRALAELVELRGAPRRLRLDNGPEFISAALKDWVARHTVELLKSWIATCSPACPRPDA